MYSLCMNSAMIVKLITVLYSSNIVFIAGSCDFEENFCGWSNNNWVRTKYKSNYKYSGPQQASNGEFYIYFDALTASGATSAQLITNTVNTATDNCLSFQYHMYGEDVDRLDVKVTGNNANQKVINGNQGDTWKCMVVALYPSGDTIQVRFTAYGQSGYGVIALDDIRLFYSSNCPLDFQSSNGTCEINPESSTTISTSIRSVSTVETIQTTKTPTHDPFKDKIPYIVAVPAGVVVLIIPTVLIAICIKRKKNKHKDTALPYMEGHTVQRPSVSPSTRYPSLPHINPAEEYETIPADHYYDSVKTPADDDYLTPRSSVYGGPLGSSMEDKTGKDDYIILPAITAGQGNTALNPNQIPPSSYRKKISISDQGNVTYSTYIENSKNTPYNSAFNDYIDPI